MTEIIRATLACATVAVMLVFANAAHAIDCFPKAEVTGALTTRYSEAPQVQGLTNDGRLMQIWAGESGTWTIIVITPQGMACIVGVGLDFADARGAAKPNL